MKEIGDVSKTVSNPARELGTAPTKLAANNRMSPAGVSLLYTSEDSQTCIAEVRPSIGEDIAIGKFQAVRDLLIFDFTALRSGELRYEPLSYFDPLYEKRHANRKMLEYLHEEIARPVRMSDTAYIVTQALAEFIRCYEEIHFDGVAFKSVQHQTGPNIVLFDQGYGTRYGQPHKELKQRFGLSIESSNVSIHRISEIHYVERIVDNYKGEYEGH